MQHMRGIKLGVQPVGEHPMLLTMPRSQCIIPSNTWLTTQHQLLGELYQPKSSCSPCSICVAVSTPVLGGTNCGVGGLSRKASVCVVLSASGTTSVSSSRYTSVC